MTEPGPPVELTDRAREFVADVDALIPGLLDAVHLTGSGASGDWQHDSDIDLVFETSRFVTVVDAKVLVGLHAATAAAGHCVDGIYLTAGQIASGPDGIRSAPQVVSGDFGMARPDGQLTWVTWLEMLHGSAARVNAGRLGSWSKEERDVDTASAVSERASAASRDNLRSYWMPYASDTAARLAARSDDDTVPAEAIEWLALGAQRLVVTIETGRVVSKSAAAEFAAQRWPEYAELLTRVLASRRGEAQPCAAQPFTVRDARRAAALVLDCAALADC
ncbi:hypothetical protein E3T54_05550 [Cryobacterium sp. Sr8]|uniref:aminoglycoside adenylyltransferase domain-containing protein n=1 Tax=Cryobacterium sp. Sr8 TaxID=1259203 RepID=UPI00106A1CFF|nr:hypothetical protein [Cryobacterium sp. Sr8]TFD78979.1 hypothetical protein E3T54_05550 [Cryobacterium sp. Sr8]